MAVFGINIEMSPYESKQVPKRRYLVGKNFKNFQKHFFFLVGHKWLQIMSTLMSAVDLVGVKI